MSLLIMALVLVVVIAALLWLIGEAGLDPRGLKIAKLIVVLIGIIGLLYILSTLFGHAPALRP
jgi:membrane protein YdbS with pleckstrin-like domain